METAYVLCVSSFWAGGGMLKSMSVVLVVAMVGMVERA
jgi:hypothetical protein